MDIQEIITENPIPTAIVIFGSGFAIGGVAGYLLSKHRSNIAGDSVYYTVVDEEITETTTTVPDEDVFEDPVMFHNLVDYATVKEIVEVNEYSTETIEVVEEIPQPEEPKRENVFMSDDGWDYDKELAQRDPKKPYVIHRDEFFGEDEAPGYSQLSLTYYEGDAILTDEDDTPIHRHEKVVGEIRFGYGSQDKNVYYARNDDLKAEYEILRSSDSYVSAVLGVEAEEQYARQDRRRPEPRFKED